MFRILFGCVTVLMISLCLSSAAHADVLILQSGQKIVGQIIEREELRITVDVKGTPHTYFLGEIASINGMKVEPLQIKNVGLPPPAKVKKPGVGPTKKKAAAKQIANKPSRPHSPSSTDAAKLEALAGNMREMMSTMTSMNKNVVPTPDGGIIVVSPDKIVKYDKNLNVVKEVDLRPKH